MITDIRIKFGPGCRSYGWSREGGFHAEVTVDGVERLMTAQEYEWFIHPLTHDLDELQALNMAESGAPVCEQCGEFHPDLAKAPAMTAYDPGPQPQPLLCPICTEEWVEYWQEMWSEWWRSGLL